MKHLRLLNIAILCFLFAMSIFAAERPVNAAYEIAYRKLFQANTATSQKSPSYIQPQLLLTASLDGAHANKAAYYIYSNANNKGFVIVSGDDRAEEVLAYSLDETIDIGNLPTNMQYWLENYKEEIQWLVENPTLTTTIDTKQKVQTLSYATVTPLTAHIKWNQGAPYNNLCPLIPSTTNRTVAGCVATGMSIVMRYYTWPLQGVGSNTYTTETHKIEISETFTGTFYDWANMTNTYSNSSTAAQNAAVAKLIYHAGVAVNMNFDASSGALVTNMANALKNNFGFDTKLNLLYRDFHSRAEWMSIIKDELLLQRPVLYAGSSQTGGHLFVCDGFDSNDFFHFNWGWGGMSNGYYKISALSPSSQGIGGGIGGYNKSQNILVGLQKPTSNSTHTLALNMNLAPSATKTNFPRTETFGVTLSKLFNYSINSFSGSLGLALYQNGAFVHLLGSNSVNELKPNFGWNSLSFNTVNVPSTVANGNYQIFAVYRADSSQPWRIVRSKVGTPNALNLQLANNMVTISLPANVGPQLILDNLTLSGSIYQNRMARFSVQLTNQRSEYNSIIGIYLQSRYDETISQLIREDVNLIEGETTTVYFTSKVTLVPGEYFLAAMYDPNNNRTEASNVSMLGEKQLVTIKAEPTGLPSFNLMSDIAFANNSHVDRNDMVLNADVINNGDFFDERMIAFIFPRAGGSSLTYIGRQTAVFDPAERRVVTFKGSVTLDPADYLIGVYYYHPIDKTWKRMSEDSKYIIPFTLKESPTGFQLPETIAEVSLYPNPARDFVQIHTDQAIKSIRIYHIDGRLLNEKSIVSNKLVDVSALSAGHYIMLIETTTNTLLARFIKQ